MPNHGAVLKKQLKYIKWSKLKQVENEVISQIFSFFAYLVILNGRCAGLSPQFSVAFRGHDTLFMFFPRHDVTALPPAGHDFILAKGAALVYIRACHFHDGNVFLAGYLLQEECFDHQEQFIVNFLYLRFPHYCRLRREQNNQTRREG